MGEWGYSKKKGRAYRKKPKSRKPSFPDLQDLRKNSTGSSIVDEHNRRRLVEFALMKKEQYKKKEQLSKIQKKQAKFDKVIHLDMGHAKGFLIMATPVLVQLDPTLASVYTSYKVGKYGYCFLKKVNDDYKISGNFDESLKTVAKQEIEKKITSKIKSSPLEKSSQYAANRVWTFCKETYSDGKMDPKWDKFGESALAKSFEEVGGKLF